MKLQQFDGGLNTRKAPQMLALNEAVVYNNVDNEPGTLRSVKAKLATDLLLDRFAYFYEAAGTWFSSMAKRDYLEFQNNLYYTDRGAEFKRVTGAAVTNACIANPTSSPALTVVTAPDKPNSVTAIVADSGTADIPAQEHSYMFVNVGAQYYSEGQIVVVDLNSGRAQTPSEFDFAVTLDKPLTPLQVITAGYGRTITIGTAITGKAVTFSKVSGAPYGPGGINVYRLYEGKWRLIGNLADEAATLADEVYDISANAELDESKIGPLKGTYQYVYTYYNAALGLESGPSPLSAESKLFGSMTVTGTFLSSDPQVTHVRLYRVGGRLAEFTRVAQFAVGVPNYSDTIRDADVEGTILGTEIYDAAPVGLKYLTESYAVLFAAVGNTVRFTPVGVPHAWPDEYVLQYDAPVTGLAAVANGVLVFTKYKTHIVTGTGPTSLSSQLLSADQGCISHDSVQTRAGAAIWASTDGLCTSSGDLVTVITKDKLGKIALTPVDSLVFDEVYYCLNDTGELLAFDLRYTPIFKQLTLGISALAKGNDVLYGWADGKLHELFASTALEEFSWRSPRFIEGRATENKLYKKVYIYSKGSIILEVYINDSLVISKTLATEDGHVIQVPQELQRGFFIQFAIRGTGEVYELEYEASRRNE